MEKSLGDCGANEAFSAPDINPEPFKVSSQEVIFGVFGFHSMVWWET